MPAPDERTVAAALQRVLLPPGLPQLAGWGMATLYEPAGEAVLVGGDFYDWFSLPNGHVLFLVGDVSGKGPVAGALGMSIRKALKGITWVTHDPVAALPLLQMALADEFADAFASLCLVELAPGDGRVRLVLAGHPAPWMRRAGRYVEVLAPANGLLGPLVQTQWSSVDLQLSAGDLLMLFSDGLTEARTESGQQFGEGPLEAFLASLPANLSSYETVLQADQHLRRVTLPLTDDVVIAVLNFQPVAAAAPDQSGPAEVVSLRLSPDSSSVALARKLVGDVCQRWEADPQAAAGAMLVASELVTNAVLHARTEFELRLCAEPHGMRIEVQDHHQGGPVAAARRGSDRVTEHGRGLAVVKALSRDSGVTPTDGGKTVWAVVALREPAPTG